MTPEEAAIDEPRASLFQRFAPILPALALIAIAGQQIGLARFHDLDPWKGGGFGMFSTAEGAGARHTHLFVSRGGDEFEVDPPRALEGLDERLRVLPSEQRLGEYARELSEALRAVHPDHTAVRIEIWQTRYDVDDLTPETTLIRDFSSEAPASGAG